MVKAKQKLLLEKGTVEDREKGLRMFRQLMDALIERPIIGHKEWATSITTKQKMQIKLERMKQIKEADGNKITEATDYEALIYVSTASLSVPLSHHWYNIYAFLFRKFYPEQAGEIFHEYEGQALDSYELSKLQDLKRWLYKVSKRR